ncbi:MAG TPA: hypothetical protein VHZ98_14155 [Galbitalea sp.]|nr:hypothetical protein [Galbitalea sp.]
MTNDRQSGAMRAAARVSSWAEFYTFGLPDDVRNERLDEVRSDLHEQVTSADGHSSDRSLARRILGRSIRGIVADVSWRRDQLRGLAPRPLSKPMRVVVALAVAAGVAVSSMLFVSSETASSNASLAEVQVGDLEYQVRSEMLFVVPLSVQFAEEVKEVGSDPNYTAVLPQEREGVATEWNNLRVLLSQRASRGRSWNRALPPTSIRSWPAGSAP